MGWRGWFNARRGGDTLVASAAPQAVTAAAQPAGDARTQMVPKTDSWQAEAWAYYDDLGEFRYGIDWRANMVSRVRLRVGRIRPGTDEPELLDSGPVVDILNKLLNGAVAGPEHMMRSSATQLGVPGECWLVGETKNPTTEEWRIRSAAEIRRSTKTGATWEVIDDAASGGGQEKWRTLSKDALVCRVWEPHARKFHIADSPARAARTVMRELELVNRHISAQYLSRLASAGLLLIPDEISFPVRPEFEDAFDPFMAEWVETARATIQNPGSAGAAVPIPMRAAAELLEKIRFIDFSLKGDEKILEKRDSAIRRLATQMDLPAEILLGMGDVNHWSAWQLEESGVKVHILPMVERICYAFTVGYLTPRMKAAGLDNLDEFVVWYDASEITMRPDRSVQATEAYDRNEIDGEAYRREIGMDETDMPDDVELERQILLQLIKEPTLAAAALKALTGRELDIAVPAPAGGAVPPPTNAPADQAPPDTQVAPPPPPDDAAASSRAAAMGEALRFQVQEAKAIQADYQHWFTKQLGGWSVKHPDDCRHLPTQCPYRDAAPPAAMPGRSGTYAVDLINGRLHVGGMRQDLTGAYRRT